MYINTYEKKRLQHTNFWTSHMNNISLHERKKITNLLVDKKIVIKGFLKDHRVFMTSVIAALSFGGNWYIMRMSCTPFRTILGVP